MAIEAVIFDIGGVLELNPRTGWQGRWADRLGIGVGELERRLAPIWARGSLGTVSLGWVQRRVAETLGLSRARLGELMDDLWAEYLGTPNEELMRYFASLRPRRRTGIVSNSFVGARERERARYGFEELCDALVYSHEVGCLKPEPRIFEIACERLGVAAQAVLFLDDVPEFVAAARALGMRALRFTETRRAIAELERLLGADGGA
jgi:HAD superfamily hydrolase (TIGR01509 family)